MDKSAAPNADQIEHWNGVAGERWVTNQQQIDSAIDVFGAKALELLNPEPGERILEVGCGSGTTSLALAARVGESGHVLGLDVSEPMLNFARSRTSALSQVTLVQGDASSYPLSPSFDAMFSRFGVMFFDRPALAFANLRRGLRPGARMVFVCWQRPEQNAWVWEPLQAMLPLLPDPPAPPVPNAPGPFAFADPEYLTGQLTDAGFLEIDVQDLHAPITLSNTGVEAAVEFAFRVGPGARLTADLEPELQDRIRGRFAELFGKVAQGQRVDLQGAAWLVSARNP